MTRLRRCGAVLLLAALAGCLRDGGGEEEAAPPAGAPVTAGGGNWPLVYAGTGHPVTALPGGASVAQVEAEVEALADSFRVAGGLGSLVSDPSLADVARGHSEHMFLHSFFGHQNPELDWPTDRARSAGIPFSGLGENIAAGPATAAEVFAAWLASPSHRETLERPDWTRQGVGYAHTAAPGHNHYWTHGFLR